MKLNTMKEAELLELALEGLLARRADVSERMRELRTRRVAPSPANGIPVEVLAPVEAPRRREFSAEARERISRAQKKRWRTWKRSR